MKLPVWLKGGFIGIAYALVILFLKGICDTEWCFADIFLPFIIQPIGIFDYFFTEKQIYFFGSHIVITIISVWFVIGALIGIIYKIFKSSKI